jgi:hypothetical protein
MTSKHTHMHVVQSYVFQPFLRPEPVASLLVCSAVPPSSCCMSSETEVVHLTVRAPGTEQNAPAPSATLTPPPVVPPRNPRSRHNHDVLAKAIAAANADHKTPHAFESKVHGQVGVGMVPPPFPFVGFEIKFARTHPLPRPRSLSRSLRTAQSQAIACRSTWRGAIYRSPFQVPAFAVCLSLHRTHRLPLPLPFPQSTKPPKRL